MDLRHEAHDSAAEWVRAREILDEMASKRTAYLASAGHSHSDAIVHVEQNDRPPNPTLTKKLGTLHDYDNSETDRAREILERMKRRRERFSQLLVGVGASPTPTKQSLTETESTAELSWVSSTSDDEVEAFIYSEEEASNGYDDYAYRSSGDSLDDDDDNSSSSSSSSCSLSIYSGGTSSHTSSLISNSSFQKSVLQALEDIRSYDLRYVNIPNALTAASSSKKLGSRESSLVMKRKSPQTSRARNLYRQSSKGSVNSYSYLKTERTGPGGVVARLRADLAAISERRSMLTSMLESVQHLKSEEIDFSVVASTILSTDPKLDSTLMAPPIHALARYEMAGPDYVATTQEKNMELVEFDGKWSVNDALPESSIQSFGFPISELQWAGSEPIITGVSFDSNGDNLEWDKGDQLQDLIKEDSVRGSMYFSDSSTTDASEDRLPLHIEFTAKNAPLAKVAAEPPRALRSAEYLKALYNPRPDEVNPTAMERKYGGIYHIARLTIEVDELTDRSLSRRRLLARDDFNIPYNVEDRFCGGLYHIASQTRPPSKRALI
jgi:hypothetical protein